MITVRIDVTKIDKSRLFKGQKGTYLDIVLVETPDDQYGNSHMVVQSVSKEERQQGVRGAILGNAKSWPSRRANGDEEAGSKRSNPQPVAAPTGGDEDVPF